MSMRGASAEALAAMSAELGVVLSGGADAAALGSELFELAGLLRSEAGLRRVATDVSIEAHAKQGLIGQLFAGKVGGPALELLSSGAGRRWTATRDLADVLERLSEVATVHSVGVEKIAQLADELFGVGQLLNNSVELREALSDPARTVTDKAALVGSLLQGKALPATVALATRSLTSGYRTTAVALAEYQKVAATVLDQNVATVRVARALTDADRQRLAAALSKHYSRAVHINEVVDPDVLGGLRVSIGDDVIDGTVSSRLAEAGRKLAG